MKKIITFFIFVSVVLNSICITNISYAAENLPQEYEEIASTSNLSLYLHTINNSFVLKDKRNGYLWKSVVDKEVYDFNDTNQQWINYMTSLFTFDYTDLKSNQANIKRAYSAVEPSNLKVKRINNGVVLDYEFTDVDIQIVIEIKIENDSLNVRIPSQDIREKGINGLVNIEVLPFFGAADRKVDGYIMYPDGCGALMKYENANIRQGNVNVHTWNLYGPENVSIENEYSNIWDKQKFQALLPVFGVKNSNNAFIAIASEGEANASINLYPEGYVVDLNRISYKFLYRHSFSILNSDNSKEIGARKVDKEIIRQTNEIRYIFLNNNESNYSGMANAYRENLIKNNSLKKVIESNSPIPLALDFFMGIKEDRLLFDKFIVMTSFDQAKVITEKFMKNGVEGIHVNLIGWTKGGYGVYPINWPAEGKIGGTKGLKKYSEFAKENGIDLYIQTNFVNAIGSNGGFSKRNDVVMQANKLYLTDSKKNLFLLNPAVAFNLFKKFITILPYDVSNGVAFNRIGATIYNDYNRKNPSSRVNTVDYWVKMLEVASKEGRNIAVEGGNAYVLKYADRLYSIPDKTSDYYITDEEIPFYQLVVHGMIPYTSEPGNIFYDPVKQKLKWVEYGCMPYYKLTYQSSNKLKYTEYKELYSSNYNDWIDTSTNIYKEFNKRLKGVYGENMVWHEKLNESLYKVKYSNGTTVYINYAPNEAICDGYIIKAEDYLVVEK